MKLPVFSRSVYVVSAAIAMGVGLVVLAGYLLNIPLVLKLRVVFLQWAVFLAAVALLVGVINLLRVHLQKMSEGVASAVYSLVLVIAFGITFLVGLVFGQSHPSTRWIFEAIQVPIEASLMALLAISLAVASIRLLQRRINLLSVVFVITALLILLGTGAALGGGLPFVSDLIRPWLAQVPAAAGARGILIGVALGIIATGLRVLTGTDRPYGG